MKIELTESEKAIGLELTHGGYRQYSAKAAQLDLDALCGKGEYTIDGDTYHGYFIRHKSGSVVIRPEHKFPPRYLVIATVSLFRG